MSGQAGRIFQRHIGRARDEGAIQMLNCCDNHKRYVTILRLKLFPTTAS